MEIPTRVGKTSNEGDSHERHRRPRRRGRPDRTHSRCIAAGQRRSGHDRRPAGRRRQHVPRRGDQRSLARGSRRPRRHAPPRQGGHPGTAVHHPRRQAGADLDRLLRAPDGLPVQPDASPERHRADPARPSRRARRRGASAQGADHRHAGRQRRDRHVRRRRHHPRVLRRRRRRHAQHRPRTDGHRVRRRQLRGVVRARRRTHDGRDPDRRGDPGLGEGGPDGHRTTARRNVSDRRPARGRAGGTDPSSWSSSSSTTAPIAWAT